MSLLGKILALLNFFGVVALMVLAFMDYSKRQAWAYSVLRHDLAVRGLPLDDKERGPQADPDQPLVSQLSEATLKDMFSQVGGDPKATQVGEVDRVKSLWQNKIASLPDRPALLTLSRMLLPLADTYPERE